MHSMLVVKPLRRLFELSPNQRNLPETEVSHGCHQLRGELVASCLSPTLAHDSLYRGDGLITLRSRLSKLA